MLSLKVAKKLGFIHVLQLQGCVVATAVAAALALHTTSSFAVLRRRLFSGGEPGLPPKDLRFTFESMAATCPIAGVIRDIRFC